MSLTDVYTDYELMVEEQTDFPPCCEHSEHARNANHADGGPIWEVLVFCHYCGVNSRVLFCDRWVQWFSDHPIQRLRCAVKSCNQQTRVTDCYLVLGQI